MYVSVERPSESEKASRRGSSRRLYTVYHSLMWWSSARLGRLWCWWKISVGDPGSQCHWGCVLEHPEGKVAFMSSPDIRRHFFDNQDDNAPAHCAMIVCVTVLHQSPLSPYYIPTEHLWDEIHCVMDSRDGKLQNLQELGQVRPYARSGSNWATTPCTAWSTTSPVVHDGSRNYSWRLHSLVTDGLLILRNIFKLKFDPM